MCQNSFSSPVSKVSHMVGICPLSRYRQHRTLGLFAAGALDRTATCGGVGEPSRRPRRRQRTCPQRQAAISKFSLACESRSRRCHVRTIERCSGEPRTFASRVNDRSSELDWKRDRDASFKNETPQLRPAAERKGGQLRGLAACTSRSQSDGCVCREGRAGDRASSRSRLLS